LNNIRASSSWDNNSPDRAFDGDRQTMWNAGSHAPHWIEGDLGASTELGSIALTVIQTPEGETIHEVWVADVPIGVSPRPLDGLAIEVAPNMRPDIPSYAKHAKLAHTFKGYTKDNQRLQFDFLKKTFARFVLVRTTESPSWVAWVEIELRAARAK
jgi:hypothetical protein